MTTTTHPVRARAIGIVAARTITDAGMSVEQAAAHLHLTLLAMRARLKGVAPFEEGELRSLWALTGSPAAVLIFRRDTDAAAGGGRRG